MRWPWQQRRRPCPSEDATAAAQQADRALTDARNLDGRVDRVARDAEEIRRVNHIALSVARSIQRRA